MLFSTRPKPRDIFTGEVDDGFAAIQVERCIVRKPARLYAIAYAARRVARKRDDFIAAPDCCFDDVPPDETRGTCESENHAGVLKFPIQPAEREIVAGAVGGPTWRIDVAVGFDDGLLATDAPDAAARVFDQFFQRIELRLCRLAVVEIADETDADGDVVEVIAVDMTTLNLPVPAVADFDFAVL